jgi:predicted PurR-regulated permease PerM
VSEIDVPRNDQLAVKETVLDESGTNSPVMINPAMLPSGVVVRIVLITLLILYVAGLVTSLLSSLIHLIFLIVLSILFAYLMEPLVKLVQRPFENSERSKYMPKALAIGVAYLIVFSVLGIGIALIAPLAVEQGKEFATKLPTYATTLQERFNSVNGRYRYRLPKDLQDGLTTRLTEFAGNLGERVTGTVGEFLIELVSYLPWLILIPILAFFFLKDINLFRISLLRILPHGDWRTRVEAVLEDFNTTLAAYARAQLIACVTIGVVCTIGFYLIGLNYAVLLGILAGIFEFVPLIGPVTVAIIVVLTASFSDNPWDALYVAIFLLVLRMAQDYVIYPRIIREGIHLHPLAIILSVLMGEQIAGIAGVFISIPVVALLTVLYKHILEHSSSTGLLSGLLAPKENSEEIPLEDVVKF